MADGSKALRRAAAELTALDEADIEAILQGLEPEARARLAGLMDDYRGAFVGASADPHVAPEEAPRFSPWLEGRLGASAEGDLTPHARAMLREAARRMGWRKEPVRPQGPAGGVLNLMDRLR